MNIIITGASRGIGKETALYLSKTKANEILITGRNEEAMKKVADLAEYRNIFHYVLDFNNFDTAAEQFKIYCKSKFGNIDLLVNNAGNLVKKSFESLSNSDIRSMMEVNYIAPLTLIRILLPMMKKGSHIVNISSMGGYQGSVKFKGLSAYSASKAALACMTECLASEFSDLGVSVNCLALGSAQTEMLEEAFPGYKSPVSAREMGEFIGNFAVTGNRLFNGKILPIAVTTP